MGQGGCGWWVDGGTHTLVEISETSCSRRTGSKYHGPTEASRAPCTLETMFVWQCRAEKLLQEATSLAVLDSYASSGDSLAEGRLPHTAKQEAD
jgi:hypothetical protein